MFCVDSLGEDRVVGCVLLHFDVGLDLLEVGSELIHYFTIISL